MATYMMFIREKPVFDNDAMAKYQAANRAAPPNPDLTPLVAYGKIEALEGEAPDGMVVLSFPNAEAAMAWYNSPEYQEAIKLRKLGADYRALMVEGL